MHFHTRLLHSFFCHIFLKFSATYTNFHTICLFLILPGHLACAIHLLDAGSLVNHTDCVQKTSLCHLLKQHGTSIFSEENNDKKLSLDKLASFTDVLLQYGANPNSKNDDEETPYSLANSMQDKEVLDVINTALGTIFTLLLYISFMVNTVLTEI